MVAISRRLAARSMMSFTSRGAASASIQMVIPALPGERVSHDERIQADHCSTAVTHFGLENPAAGEPGAELQSAPANHRLHVNAGETHGQATATPIQLHE